VVSVWVGIVQKGLVIRAEGCYCYARARGGARFVRSAGGGRRMSLVQMLRGHVLNVHGSEVWANT
jgi:hypothetical protein